MLFFVFQGFVGFLGFCFSSFLGLQTFQTRVSCKGFSTCFWLLFLRCCCWWCWLFVVVTVVLKGFLHIS